MLLNKILVAYDGSMQSEKAYDLALDLASKYSAQLIVLSVARPAEPPLAVEINNLLDSVSQYYEGSFRAMSDRAKSLLVDAAFEVRAGHPAEEILRFADERGVDTIFMGHRGEGALRQWLLGSVAKRVLSYAHCTVVVVR